MSRSGNVGFRVFTKIERPTCEVIEAFARLESTVVSDAMNRFGGMDDNIRPAEQSMKLCGPAVTVRVRPGDNLMVYKAFEIAQPGDILVIESRGYTTVAQWGDLTSMIAKGLRLGGAVMDGSLRDTEGIVDVGLPVFAKPATTPQGSLKDGPGEVNVPVAVGGVPVLPGDVILADANGVVVVPRLDAEAVLRKAQAAAAAEVKKVREFGEGKFIPDWLEPTLESKGCEVVDEKWG